MREKLLNDEGLQRKYKGDVFSLRYLELLEFRTKMSEDHLLKALSLQHKQQSKWQEQAEYRRKRREAAIREDNQKHLADLQKEIGFADAERVKLAQEVATTRDLYVQNVAALRKALDEAPQKIEDWKKNHPDIHITQIPPSVRSYLGKVEKTITTKEVALEPDKAVNWVEAILDGKPKKKCKMVLDPDVDVVRMSADSATALGIKLPDEGTIEDVAMTDGQKLPARRMTLKSVQVGPFAAENVECLVILKGSEAPPLLGASFLGRFTYRIDPEAEKLTLTRVELKQPSKLSRGL
jgi:clan AA aspartic protease (TIGR02281 family)